MHETIEHPEAMPRAEKFIGLLMEKFFDPKTKTIGEYFDDSWAPIKGDVGNCVEPGHQAEWAWLLRKHDRLSGSQPNALASELLRSALRWADPKTGFLIDEAEREGSARRTSRRTWPQTELAKAWIAEAEVGKSGAGKNATAVLRSLADHYLDKPFIGGTDQFDQDGRALTKHVPASTFYHIFCAAAEADRVLRAT